MTGPAAHATALCPSPLQAEPLPPLAPAQADALLLQADQGEARAGDWFQLSGAVRARQGQQLLRAGQARYQRSTARLEAQGGIHYQQPGLVVKGRQILLELKPERAQIDMAHYYLPDQGGRGQAQSLQFQPGLARLEEASYTTCAGERPAWHIAARSIRLDQARNEGVARHLTLNIKQVPVFYLPYISFPLQGRKSGWLTPQLGYSQSNGADIALPYYLNLAPQRDLTLIPRQLARRGLQLGTEFRYLNQASEGRLAAEYLPRDRQRTGQRSRYSWRHQGWLGRARYGLRLDRVSDRDYFRDLGSRLADTSQSQLESRADIALGGPGWRASALVQDFQGLDNNRSRPYQLLPRLELGGERAHGRWRYRLDGQYSRFYRDPGDQAQRLLLQPALSYQARRPWGYLVPAARLRHSRYLVDSGASSTSLQATASVFSLDAGLVLQRQGASLLQTLEPRLNYSFSPYRERQNQLPNFDTAPLDINYGQLFRDFRYNGGDRVGDQNRLTLGLGSALARGSDGRQWLRLDLAQAYYLADQRVALPSEPARRAGDRLLAGELRANLGEYWQGRASAFQQWGQKRPDKLAIQVNYAAGEQRLLELGYRYRRGLLQQVGAAGYLRLTGPWRLAAKWLYSLRDRRTPEAMLGLSYGACCWRVSLLARHYIRDASGQSDRSFVLRFELPGLTGGNRQGTAPLARDILGFSNEG